MKRLLMALLVLGLLAAMLPGAALAGKYVDYGWGYGPNQGNADKVVLVQGPAFCTCEDPEPGKKVEGSNLGRYLTIWSDDPIYGVSVKSGNDAHFWVKDSGTSSGKFWIKIKGTKDISNYVVWTCEEHDCPLNGIGRSSY